MRGNWDRNGEDGRHTIAACAGHMMAFLLLLGSGCASPVILTDGNERISELAILSQSTPGTGSVQAIKNTETDEVLYKAYGNFRSITAYDFILPPGSYRVWLKDESFKAAVVSLADRSLQIWYQMQMEAGHTYEVVQPGFMKSHTIEDRGIHDGKKAIKMEKALQKHRNVPK